MADTLIPSEFSPGAILWTREDCAKLEEAGILNYRYELVAGVINRMGQNMPHANVVRLLLEWMFSVFGGMYVVTQTSIDVRPEDNPTNEPMPDAILLARPADQFSRYPKPGEIRLLVEVSDSTARYDLTTKARLYARAGIVEYWVVSLPDRALTMHRDPQNGTYREVQTYAENQQAAALAAPDKSVFVSQLLPAANAGPAE